MVLSLLLPRLLVESADLERSSIGARDRLRQNVNKLQRKLEVPLRVLLVSATSSKFIYLG